jgi:predicted kinase
VSPQEALAGLRPAPRFVVLMCGVAGSGKTTFSQALEGRGFARLSIDETVWIQAGRYGLDYPPEAYDAKVEAARVHLLQDIARLLDADHAVVVDSAFWSRAHRDAFVSRIAAHGGRHRLVFLQAPKALLTARLDARRSRFDANAARPIDDALLDRFLAGFEPPGADEDPLIVTA